MTYIEVPPALAPAEWSSSFDPFSQGQGSGPIPTRIVSGYPDTGSIATFTPDKKRQIQEIINQVKIKYPLQEVGTGKLKFHKKPDGSKITYCGTIRPDAGGNVAACKNKPYEHQIKGLPNSCKRRACPECWPDWSKKGSQRASGKLNGRIREIIPKTLQDRLCEALEASQTMSEDQVKVLVDAVLDDADRWLPRHIVFSPDIKEIARLIKRTERALEKMGIDTTKDPWKYRDLFHKKFHQKYRRKLDQVMKIAGLDGGMEISHDIRLKKDKDARKADRDLDANRYRAILNLPGWRYNVHFSPHSHTAAWGFLMDATQFHKLTGWIYVNYGTVYNAAGLVNYLLSHAPDNPGLHSIRYFGDLNPAFMQVEGEIKIPEFPPCEECLADGIPREKAEMVIAKLASVEYQKGPDNRTHVNAWEFMDGGISERPYRTTKIIQVFRRRPALRLLPEKVRDPGGPGRDKIPSWISDEDRQERERLQQLQKKEWERIRKAEQWLPWAEWDRYLTDQKKAREKEDLKKVRFIQDVLDRHKWRRWYSVEEYAAAGAAEKVLTWDWI